MSSNQSDENQKQAVRVIKSEHRYTSDVSGVNFTSTENAEIKVPFWAPYAKAVVAAIISFLLAFLSALLPFIEQGHVVSVVGWITASIAGIVALSASAGIVYVTPNVGK